jgi:hypothetical protein
MSKLIRNAIKKFNNIYYGRLNAENFKSKVNRAAQYLDKDDQQNPLKTNVSDETIASQHRQPSSEEQPREQPIEEQKDTLEEQTARIPFMVKIALFGTHFDNY